MAGVKPAGAISVTNLPCGTKIFAQGVDAGVIETRFEKAEQFASAGNVGRIARDLNQCKAGFKQMHMGVLAARKCVLAVLGPAAVGCCECHINRVQGFRNVGAVHFFARGFQEPCQSEQHTGVVIEIARGVRHLPGEAVEGAGIARSLSGHPRALPEIGKGGFGYCKAIRRGHAEGCALGENVDLPCSRTGAQLSAGFRCAIECEAFHEMAAALIEACCGPARKGFIDEPFFQLCKAGNATCSFIHGDQLQHNKP